MGNDIDKLRKENALLQGEVPTLRAMNTNPNPYQCIELLRNALSMTCNDVKFQQQQQQCTLNNTQQRQCDELRSISIVEDFFVKD